MSQTIEVTLPDALIEYIRKKVESGDFNDESGVIEDAIRSKKKEEAAASGGKKDTVIIQYKNPPVSDG